jgi:hypothetical protein
MAAIGVECKCDKDGKYHSFNHKPEHRINKNRVCRQATAQRSTAEKEEKGEKRLKNWISAGIFCSLFGGKSGKPSF